MARTRQKRKARQRQQQQQQQATRRDATAKQQPSNPAEAAVIQRADATEAADELEELVEQEPVVEQEPAVEQEPVVEQEPADEPVPAAREPKAKPRRAVERKQPRRERKPAVADKRKEPRQRGRIVSFLIQVWAELRRVQWPDRNQVTQATGVVIVFCFLAGAFLAFWDFVFGELVTSLL
jgi:preprotein translocase SecE subunit